MALAQALHLQSAKREKDLPAVVAQGLLRRGSAEYRAIADSSGAGYNEAYGWVMAEFYRCIQDGLVAPQCAGHLLILVQNNVTKMRGAAADVLMYLNQQIPLPYTHLLELMVTLYVFMAPIALVPGLLWLAPAASGLVTIFYYGFFCLSTQMLLDPFRDEDGFNLKAFFESTQVGAKDVDKHVPMTNWHLGSGTVGLSLDNADADIEEVEDDDEDGKKYQ